MKTIIICDKIGSDIRSRSNAKKIEREFIQNNNNIILDFSNVEFISRSFADELYSIMEKYSKIEILNMSDFVKTMYQTVSLGRKNERIRENEKSEIKKIDNMNDLSKFLL